MADKTAPTDKLKNIPKELRDLPNWVQYYLKKDPARPDKKPAKVPTVKWTIKENRRTLDHLLTRKPTVGFQIAVEKSDGYVFIDIDHCRNNETGEIEPSAQEIVEALDTYTEISPSGTGLRLVCRGKLDQDFHADGHPVEIYSGNGGKLMAMTGAIYDLAYAFVIQDRQEQAEALLAKCQSAYGVAPAKVEAASGVIQPDGDSLILERVSDIEAEPIYWLWKDRIPAYVLSLITGNMDVGKTCVVCDIVARVSNFTIFPGEPKGEEGYGGEVIMMTNENDGASVIKPRLVAAGADTKNVHILKMVSLSMPPGTPRKERFFAFDKDMAAMEKELAENPLVSLITIDPLSDFFGKGNMNSKQDVREVYSRITDICKRFRVTVLVVENFNKKPGQQAIHRAGGSEALAGGARAAFMLGKVVDDDGEPVEDEYAFHFIKGNMSRRKVGIRYRIESVPIASLPFSERELAAFKEAKEDTLPRAVWGDEDSGTADDLLRKQEGVEPRVAGKRGVWISWLGEYLADGEWHRSVEMWKAAKSLPNFVEKTIKRAIADAGCEHDERRDGWYIAKKGTAKPEAPKPVEESVGM